MFTSLDWVRRQVSKNSFPSVDELMKCMKPGIPEFSSSPDGVTLRIVFSWAGSQMSTLHFVPWPSLSWMAANAEPGISLWRKLAVS